MVITSAEGRLSYLSHFDLKFHPCGGTNLSEKHPFEKSGGGSSLVLNFSQFLYIF